MKNKAGFTSMNSPAAITMAPTITARRWPKYVSAM